jgi:hypothetical protein
MIDGLVAMEGQGPLGGTPVEMDVLIAGRDLVAVDSVGCAVMGIDPRRIEHLRLAHERGLGEIDLKKIEVKGLSIAKVRRRFQPALWDAEVRIAKTDALVGRLAQMCDGAAKPWGRASLALTFRTRLKVDSKKYPSRRSRGFTVRIPPRGDQILFHAPYNVLYDENAQAAADELADWIRANLGGDIEIIKSPKRPTNAP